MVKIFLTFLFAVVFSSGSFAQLPSITIKKNKGTIYLMGGYNRGWFSKSDIHVHGKSYDFTLFDADGVDSPDIDEISEWDVALPQLHYRVGYFFKSASIIGIELGLDQMKYRMIPGQTLSIKGVIDDTIVDKEILVTDSVLRFSHPNGVNYLILSFIKGVELLATRSEMHSVFFLMKPGAGVVFPKTTVDIFGKQKESDFHAAGYVLALEASFRYIFAGHVFIEAGGKAAFANYSNIKLGNGESADHSFESVQGLLSIGYQFNF